MKNAYGDEEPVKTVVIETSALVVRELETPLIRDGQRTHKVEPVARTQDQAKQIK